MADLKSIVSNNVREIRLRKEMTQQELADRTSLNIRYISRLENQPQNITLDHLQALASGLSVPPSRLLSKDQNVETSNVEFSEDLERIISELRALKSRVKVMT